MIGAATLAVLALALMGAAVCLALRLFLSHDLFRPERGYRAQHRAAGIPRRH